MAAIFSLIGMAVLTALASAQASVECQAGSPICGTTCCSGPAICEAGNCIPLSGVPLIGTSVTSPIAIPTEAPFNTTVSVPIVSGPVTTVVSVNATSTTGNHTASHTATPTETDEPKPSGAAGAVLPGTGLLGVAVAAFFGIL